jgi:hypothetical protein
MTVRKERSVSKTPVREEMPFSYFEGRFFRIGGEG